MRVVASLLLACASPAFAQDFTNAEDLSLGPVPERKPDEPAVPAEAPPAVPAAAPTEPAPAPAPLPKLWRNTIAVGATGGYEYTTQQPFAGLELSVHHDGLRGIAPIGRVSASWAFADQRPLFRAEAGFLVVTPNAQNLVRLGLVGGAVIQLTDVPVPLQVGTPEEGDVGLPAFRPYGQIVAEVGGVKPDRDKGILAWGAGLRIGVAAGIGTVQCPEAPDDGCLAAYPAFTGGIYGRLRFHEGVFLEVLAGPNASLSLGYAIGPRRRESAD